MKIVETKTSGETAKLGQKLGKQLKGGEFIELTGDLGSGKTTLLKGLAKGLGVTQPISSPTFTVSRVYEIGGKSFHHFDFYRLDSTDIVALELAEAAADPSAIVAVEWAEHVQNALPAERLSINLKAKTENSRQICLTAEGSQHRRLVEAV